MQKHSLDDPNKGISVNALIIWIIFLFCAALAVPLKSHHEIGLLLKSLERGVPPLELGHLIGQQADLPLTLRMLVGGVYLAVEGILKVLAGLMMVAPEASLGYLGTPWDIKAYDQSAYQSRFLPFVTVFVSQTLLLASLPVLVLSLYRGLTIRAGLLLALVSCYAGWPPEMVNAVFWLWNHLSDWPRAYYLFGDRYLPSDVAGMAFMLFLMVWLARIRSISLPVVIMITALGQATSEHLGFVAGCAMAAHALWTTDTRNAGLRLAVVRLVYAGMTAVIVLVGMLSWVLIRDGYYQQWQQTHDLSAMINEYRQQKWIRYGQYNQLWWRVIIANFISYLFLPVVVGIAIGAARASLGRDGALGVRNHARAALGILAPLTFIMIIGAFNSGYTSDLGRQSLPLAIMLLITCVTVSDLVLSKIKSRHALIGAPHG